jgi:hypothetical protein
VAAPYVSALISRIPTPSPGVGGERTVAPAPAVSRLGFSDTAARVAALLVVLAAIGA